MLTEHSGGAPYRVAPPEPARLNRMALVAVGLLVALTIVVALVMTASAGGSRASASGGRDTSAVMRPQRPAIPDPAPDARAVDTRAVDTRAVDTRAAARVDARAQVVGSMRESGSPRVTSPASGSSGSLMSAEGHAFASALVVRSRDDTSDGVSVSVHQPATPWVVEAGTVMSAALVTALRSSVPGLVVGQVTRDVYDSPREREVLIPRGSRLVGRYETGVARGQDALVVVWTRLTFPDGRWMVLPAFASADASGTGGLRGSVDAHLVRGYIDAAVMSVVGAGAQLSQPSASFGTAGAVTTPTVGQVVAGSVGQQLTERTLSALRADAQLTPTITVRAGTQFVVEIERDLVFDGPYVPRER